MGGRSILHARCHSCGANLLAEVMDFEEEVNAGASTPPPPDDPACESDTTSLDQESSVSSLEEDTQALHQS